MTASRLALALAVGLTGCHSPSQYTSPRITGRVLDEQTRQPIKGAQVRRLSDAPRTMDPPKGGQSLDQTPSVRTGADGGFVLPSERALGFVMRWQWYSVTLSFESSGHERLTKTYGLSNSTNTPAGEPLVEAGEILLKPLGK